MGGYREAVGMGFFDDGSNHIRRHGTQRRATELTAGHRDFHHLRSFRHQFRDPTPPFVGRLDGRSVGGKVSSGR